MVDNSSEDMHYIFDYHLCLLILQLLT